MPRPARPDRVSKTWNIRKDLVERVEVEADLRVLGPALIVERALEAFLDQLTPPVLGTPRAAYGVDADED